MDAGRDVIDLRRNYFERTRGDLTIRGIWINRLDAYDGATEPALAITVDHRQTRPWIIGLSAAFKYDDPKYMAQAVKKIAEFIGYDSNVFAWMQIAYLIDDHLSDLISMPPQPTSKVLVAEGTINASDKRHSVQLFDNVAMAV